MKRKDSKQNKLDRSIERSLYASIVSIFVCMICLVGTSWAWFNTSTFSNVANMTVAERHFVTEKFTVHEISADKTAAYIEAVETNKALTEELKKSEKDITKTENVVNGVKTIKLPVTKDTLYKIHLETAGTASQGFVTVTTTPALNADGSKKDHKFPLKYTLAVKNKDASTDFSKATFYILPSEDCTLTLEIHLGTNFDKNYSVLTRSNNERFLIGCVCAKENECTSNKAYTECALCNNEYYKAEANTEAMKKICVGKETSK